MHRLTTGCYTFSVVLKDTKFFFLCFFLFEWIVAENVKLLVHTMQKKTAGLLVKRTGVTSSLTAGNLVSFFFFIQEHF